ncbi:MAG TPA: carbamoyltransferase HypF [Terriglobales bacterium]|nr:carbamoyltransferase HypF [Terriglobales bacterium]
MPIRRQVEVSGIVQGVGFRPYIYRLATDRQLVGTISNTSAGVIIEIQGPAETVDDFISRLPQEAPPLSRITDITTRELPLNGDHEFRIVASHGEEPVRTLISPDVATCDDCLREMFDPLDRRYRYPFTNCTNCGPRFTITRSIPYDRPFTSMAPFKMCPACQAEYDNPANRRFHAQPNACWDCGPQLEFWDNKGGVIHSVDPIAASIQALREGKIVAIKGLGGFHLAADATNTEAVALLRERKRRVGKPFAVMVPDLAAAEGICEISADEAAVLQSIQRPIVLLRRSRGEGARSTSPVPSVAQGRLRASTVSSIARDIAPGNNSLGVFLPYTPIHHLLLKEGNFPALVMTSGNLSEEPIAISNDEALRRLSGLADFFLVHNREILLRCDDSVVRVLPREPVENAKANMEARAPSPVRKPKPQQLRRSRGLVPVPVFLHQEVPSVLAVGGELKNTICLTKGKHAFLSQHVGDLENLESYKFFDEAISHLQKVLEIKPELIAYDLHPDYFSSKWALNRTDLPLIGVQHHHAHVAGCMAENHLDGQVIGFALDGTGYGTDGNIWGGEVLIADYKHFERAGRLEYVPLPGGAAAIHEPWRMAVSYLAQHFGNDFKNLKLPFLREVGDAKLELVLRMIERRINSPLTSSCGRLFDAVAAIAGIRNEVSYEAQAAIELEMAMECMNRKGREDRKDFVNKLQALPTTSETGVNNAYGFELSWGTRDSDLSTVGDGAPEKGKWISDASSQLALSGQAAEQRQSRARGVSPGNETKGDSAPKGRQIQGTSVIISSRRMFEELVEDVSRGTAVSEISRKFHNGLVNTFVEIAGTLRDRTSLNRVCLSGGTFHNLYMTMHLFAALTTADFEVFTQNEVPAGDGGLSLGQAVSAAHKHSP